MAFSVFFSGPVRHRVSSRKTPRKNKRMAGPHKNASPYSKCLLHGQLNTTCWKISWTLIVKATMEQYIKGWRDFLQRTKMLFIISMLINHGQMNWKTTNSSQYLKISVLNWAVPSFGQWDLSWLIYLISWLFFSFKRVILRSNMGLLRSAEVCFRTMNRGRRGGKLFLRNKWLYICFVRCLRYFQFL